MCGNFKSLFNFTPPATELEVRDASRQFVHKLSGFNVRSQAMWFGGGCTPRRGRQSAPPQRRGVCER